MRNITHVEEEIRTITGYKLDLICDRLRIDWTDEAAYDERLDRRLIMQLLSNINSDIDKAKSNSNDYIIHYASKDGTIPTWIMTKVIRFTTLISLIEYSKKELREYLCNLYDMEYNLRNNDFRILIGSLHWMRKTRNSCAHNERIIFLEDDNRIVITKYHRMLTHAYRNRLRDKQVVDVVIFLKYYNTKQEYKKLINFLKNELKQVQLIVPNQVYQSIRASLGIRQVEHLDLLQNIPKKIEYLNLI